MSGVSIWRERERRQGDRRCGPQRVTCGRLADRQVNGMGSMWRRGREDVVTHSGIASSLLASAWLRLCCRDLFALSSDRFCSRSASASVCSNASCTCPAVESSVYRGSRCRPIVLFCLSPWHHRRGVTDVPRCGCRRGRCARVGTVRSTEKRE